ncbi:MAG: thioredoxin family protein [Bacteroidota bacterium]
MKKLIGSIALVLVAAFVWMAATPNSMVADGLEVGDKAPDFQLENVDGKMVSLEGIAAEYKKAGKELKGYIVTFTCNTCPWAVKYEDRIIETHNDLADKGWPVVAIMPNDPEVQPGDSMDKMKERADEKEFPFAYLMDKGQKVYPQYGASRTPHIYLIDADMTVQYIGALDDSPKDADNVKTHYVKEAINALENGKKVDPSFTRAIGCSIKTK